MDIAKIESYPDKSALNSILASAHIDIVSPFVSGWTLAKIKPNRHDAVSLITRLPDQYHAPVAYLDNDPRPIKAALERMGNQLKVYALPTVHAKLFLNEESAWVGSANFTRNGFSKKQEILLRCDETAAWNAVFKKYRSDAKRVTTAEIDKLVRWHDLGLSKTRQKAPDDGSSPDQAVQAAASFEDFVEWLSKAAGPKSTLRKHVYERVKGKNYMSGHVYPAFNGVLAFLRKHPAYRSKLLTLDDSQIPASILSDLKTFVEAHGDEYRGPQGGYWRRYLSVALGGTQISGGAGNTVVKKCLVLLPNYMNARGLT